MNTPRLPQSELPYSLCDSHAAAAYRMLLRVYLDTPYDTDRGVGPALEGAFINLQHEASAEGDGALPHWMYPERPSDLAYTGPDGAFVPHLIVPDDCPDCAVASEAHRAEFEGLDN